MPRSPRRSSRSRSRSPGRKRHSRRSRSRSPRDRRNSRSPRRSSPVRSPPLRRDGDRSPRRSRRDRSHSRSLSRNSSRDRRQEELEAHLVEETTKRVEELVAKRVQEELERMKDKIKREVWRQQEELEARLVEETTKRVEELVAKRVQEELERMKDKIKREVQRPDKQQGRSGSLKIVPDDRVKTFPYQSVGILFYKKVKRSSTDTVIGDGLTSSTAWVAHSSLGHHIVVTAAHSLKGVDFTATDILFIPGYIPGTTPIFGRYPQVPGDEKVAWAVHPNFEPTKLQGEYDLGIVHLDRDPSTNKYVDQVVKPIQVISNLDYDSSSEWNTMGYPDKEKMHERTGSFCNMYRSDSGACFWKYGELPLGMSGSPWVMAGSNNCSNGVQAGNFKNDENKDCALSPYFNSPIDELVNLWFSQN